jgi:protocatechuate 3,4-dioxygenase beta subunit
MVKAPTKKVPPKKAPAKKKPAAKKASNAKYYFTVKNSVKVVQDRAGPKANKRVKFLTDSLVKHLHAFVKETKPTLDEWMQGINFLTRTGHLSTDWRQEYILLSDVLGISMLVETINNDKFSGETESTVLGPFYIANAPQYQNGDNICLDGKGEAVWVQGRVKDAKGKAIPGAILDVWQANEDGFYDVQQKGIQPDMNLRGVFKSGPKGEFFFRSAYPKYYPIPYDGSVGDLLVALDRNHNRPAHLHFLVTAPGYDKLVTHIFTPDCPWLKDDAVFGVKQSLIADFKIIDNAKLAAERGLPNPFREVTWDVVMSKTTKKKK